MKQIRGVARKVQIGDRTSGRALTEPRSLTELMSGHNLKPGFTCECDPGFKFNLQFRLNLKNIPFHIFIYQCF